MLHERSVPVGLTTGMRVAVVADDVPRAGAAGRAARPSVAGGAWGRSGDELIGHLQRLTRPVPAAR